MGQAAWQGARCGGTELNQDILGTQEVFSVLYPEDRWLCVCCMGITCSFLPPLTCLFRVCSVYVQGPTLGAMAEQGKVGLGSSGSSWSMGKTQMNVCVCVCVLSHFCHVHLFVLPWTVAHQAPLCMGFSRQEYWSGLPRPPLGGLPNSGAEPPSLMSPALAGGFFTTSVTWEAHRSTQNGAISWGKHLT